MTERHAHCSCGQLSLIARQEPIRVSICHCLACQRRTGSVFGVQARFRAEDIDVAGKSRRYVRVGDSGGRITFHFCADCGATVYYTLEGSPEIVAVPVGVFGDPQFPSPTRSVYESRRHGWVDVPEEGEHFD